MNRRDFVQLIGLAPFAGMAGAGVVATCKPTDTAVFDEVVRRMRACLDPNDVVICVTTPLVAVALREAGCPYTVRGLPGMPKDTIYLVRKDDLNRLVWAMKVAETGDVRVQD